MQDQPMIESHARDYRSWLLIALTVWAIVTGALTAWAWYLAAQRADVELGNAVTEGENTLCPGQTLAYSFTLTVSGAAPVDIYTSEIRLATNEHVSETRLQHFEFNAATRVEITRYWVLPVVYANPISGRGVTWEPGEYVQRISAGVVGRTELDSIDVPFNVSEGCEREH